MIRLSWLQFRAQAVTAAAALSAAAVILAATSPHRGVNAGFYHWLYMAGIMVLYLTPAMIGSFWGAPLISRELEAGTYRLAWTQSVTRTRWLAVKLGLGCLVSIATAGLLSLMITWWGSPIDQLNDSRLSPLTFGARDLTPVGYAAFAFALGVTIGLLLRRAVPAIAVTLAAFAAVQVAVPLAVRPYLIPPVRTVSPLTTSNITGTGDGGPGAPGVGGQPGPNLALGAKVDIPGAWVYSVQFTLPGGSTNLGPEPQACISGSGNACDTALARLHLRQVVTYQPASRYWAFQFAETGLYLLLALLLTGFCIWRVKLRS
ncbi:MAG TPA: ABC transporter permease [Streptosporangiaceae bacterium]|nr:ABC transporter permease [Streptosporangiaceae bacterium]